MGSLRNRSSAVTTDPNVVAEWLGAMTVCLIGQLAHSRSIKKKRTPSAGVLFKSAMSFRFPLSGYSPIATSLLSNPYFAGSFEMRAAAIIIGT